MTTAPPSEAQVTEAAPASEGVSLASPHISAGPLSGLLHPAITAKKSRIRLTEIEIQNYRAFRGSFSLNLSRGSNLLVLGENGVGKSSIFNTLVDFFEAPERALRIEANRHRFNTDLPLVRLHAQDFSSDPPAAPKIYEWSQTRDDPKTPEMRTMDKGKGCLDYRALLRVHLLPSGEPDINLFDLFLNPVLAHFQNPASSPSLTFAEDWKRIENAFKPYVWKPADLDDWIARFNGGFERVAKDAVAKASELLKKFDAELAIEIEFTPASYRWRPKRLTPPRLIAKPVFKNLKHADYYAFLNEARLSAMAIAIYFSGLSILPASGPRVLVLDDILIGLDMANRMMVLGLVERLFADWQVVILTYHKAWFEVLKARTTDGKWSWPWRHVTLRNGKSQGVECPIEATDSMSLLAKARIHLKDGDVKAAAVYARSAWEEALGWYCSEWKLLVPYTESRRQLDTQSFLKSISAHLATLHDGIDREWANSVLQEIKHARRFVLNPHVHHEPIAEEEISAEISAGIQAVEDFDVLVRCVTESDFSNAATKRENAGIASLISLSLREASAGRLPAAGELFGNAFERYLDKVLRVKKARIRYGAHGTRRDLFAALMETDVLSERGRYQLKHLRAYFLGEVAPKVFKVAEFEAACLTLLKLHLQLLFERRHA